SQSVILKLGAMLASTVVTLDLSFIAFETPSGLKIELPPTFTIESPILRGSVGFHCKAIPIRLLPAPALFEIGAMSSMYWLGIILMSRPNFLLGKNLKLAFRSAVYFLIPDFSIMPSWLRAPSDMRYLPFSFPPFIETL